MNALDPAKLEGFRDALCQEVSGGGDPALSIAEAVGPFGHVTATDFGPGMIGLAEGRARAKDLRNGDLRVADDVAAPVRSPIAKLTPEARAKLEAEVFADLKSVSDDKTLTLPLEIAIGTKP